MRMVGGPPSSERRDPEEVDGNGCWTWEREGRESAKWKTHRDGIIVAVVYKPNIESKPKTNFRIGRPP